MSLALFFATAAAFQAPIAPPAVPVIEAASRAVVIIDDDDVRRGVLVDDLPLDTYVAHPSMRRRTVTMRTDQGVVSFSLRPGAQQDFAVRFRGKLYPQRFTTVDPNPPRWLGNASRPGGVDIVPFRLGPGSAIRIVGTINGSQPLDLLFDTGASLSVIGSEGTARGLVAKSGCSNRISFGPVAVSNLPLTAIHTVPGDGIIGFDAFAGKTLVIDYGRSELRIYHERPDVTGFQRTRLYWRESAALVNVDVRTARGMLPVKAILDTGSRWSLSLSNQSTAAAQVRRAEVLGSRRGRRSDGSSVPADVYTLPAFNFAGFKMRDVQVDVERTSPSTNLPLNILGNDFLKRFDLVIDYRASEVFARSNALATTPYNAVFPFAALLTGLVSVATIVSAWFVASRYSRAQTGEASLERYQGAFSSSGRSRVRR